MNKILIVGSVGSGKTTLAKKISKILNYPHFELDQVAHADIPDRPKRSDVEQVGIIKTIDSEHDNWIFEGVFREAHRVIYELADLIIYLDMPMGIRKYQIVMRYIKQQFMLEHSHYKSNFKMLKLMFKWTNDFEYNRYEFEKFLNQYEEKLLIITKQRDIAVFSRDLLERG